jgi:hypothetical protein
MSYFVGKPKPDFRPSTPSWVLFPDCLVVNPLTCSPSIQNPIRRIYNLRLPNIPLSGRLDPCSMDIVVEAVGWSQLDNAWICDIRVDGDVMSSDTKITDPSMASSKR